MSDLINPASDLDGDGELIPAGQVYKEVTELRIRLKEAIARVNMIRNLDIGSKDQQLAHGILILSEGLPSIEKEYEEVDRIYMRHREIREEAVKTVSRIQINSDYKKQLIQYAAQGNMVEIADDLQLFRQERIYELDEPTKNKLYTLITEEAMIDSSIGKAHNNTYVVVENVSDRLRKALGQTSKKTLDKDAPLAFRCYDEYEKRIAENNTTGHHAFCLCTLAICFVSAVASIFQIKIGLASGGSG